jgi:hypothetical protein
MFVNISLEVLHLSFDVKQVFLSFGDSSQLDSKFHFIGFIFLLHFGFILFQLCLAAQRNNNYEKACLVFKRSGHMVDLETKCWGAAVLERRRKLERLVVPGS